MSPSVEDEEEERRRRRPEAEEDFLNTEGAEIWYEGGLGGWNTRELTSLLPMAVLGVAGWGDVVKAKRVQSREHPRARGSQDWNGM